MKRSCFQLAVALIACWTCSHASDAARNEVLELRSRVRPCLSGGCADDTRVLWVLSRASGTSRIIRALNSRPSWMDEAVHRALLSSLGSLPPSEPRLESDPPELFRLGMSGREELMALEFATGYPGERLLAIPSSEFQLVEAPAPAAAPDVDWKERARSWEKPALALLVLGAGLGLLAFMWRRLRGLAARWFARKALVIPSEAVHQAIYRARSLRELGTNLAECVGQAIHGEALFLEFDRRQGMLTEVVSGRDGIRTPLSEVGITPGRILPEIPSLRSAVLAHRDAGSYLAWPLMSESGRSRLLGVVLVLRPSARVRASASVIGTWMERAARFHHSILSSHQSESSHV